MYQIFVVEDELLIRQNIRNMVENMGGPYAFCGEASDGEMALSMMQDLMPDIMLTDIRMPFLDGFGLIQHAKAMMPWLKIIIISGYDEFESAQKAIALDVDLYLLKPIRAKELYTAIETVAAKLAQSRSGSELPSGYKKDEVRHVLYQHFMQQLLLGSIDTSQLLERAAALEIELVYPLYQVVMFHFEAGDKRMEAWQEKVAEVMQNNRTAQYYFNGTNRLDLLVCGKTREELSETAYHLVNVIRHETKETAGLITTLVGNIAERISAIKNAYEATDAMLKKIQTVCAGQTIDVNDTAQITADIVSFSSSFGERFGKRLLHATPEDVPLLLDEFWSGADNSKLNSMLYRYYTLVDILKTAVQIVSAAKSELDQKDIAVQFSSAYDIFIASGRRDTFETLALELLQEAVRMKQENLSFIKHSHVISRAEEYILQQYCDPNISLIGVARHVGMSPAHFSTVFSQTMGKTFISYLTALRIAKAKELLAQTDWKLSAIAIEIGYNEPNYFSHVFKKNEGITPKEYRNQFMKGRS
ncbi:helix-turn-helix domain-containing protein [Christensenellaceae bacterium OttesenSCG-928-L17]|nr:helix-turn-helix domain-containing protein [Christensenellaceae bacterium OttesenSCG-928-L17]